MVTLASHGIPRTVLNGRDKRFIKVYNRYRALLIQHLFQLLNESFDVRSLGARDPVAGKWKKLTPLTLQIKKQLGVKNPELINIRTGALIAATEPGSVVQGRYYKRKGQLYTISPYTVKFGIDPDRIPYVDDVDEKRTIIPEDISQWIVTAHEAVIPEVRAMYNDMRANLKQRASKNKGRRRK